MRNKTDQNDAWHRADDAVGLVSRRSCQEHRHAEKMCTLLTSRRLLKRKLIDLENHIRGALRAYALRVRTIARGAFEARVRELFERSDPIFVMTIGTMLDVRRAILEGYDWLHRVLLQVVQCDDVWRRLMTVSGVGPVAALSFMTAVDDPSRFKRSRDVAAYFGLTSRRWQSGSLIDVQGRISEAGDADVRRALYEAASALLTRFKRKDRIKTWGMAIAKRSSHRKATVAVARKLAVIMHAMWTGDTFYCGDPSASEADIDARNAAKDRRLLGAHA
ncbi:transposase [Bradyrhizobium sp. USDA 4011]